MRYYEQYIQPVDYEIDIFNNETRTTRFHRNPFIEKILDWNPFADQPTAWFDSKWMFGIEDGFDIVIGNPPYVQLQKMSGTDIHKAYKEQNYDSFAATGDIYCLIYERGNQLLKDKGFLCFITSNKWMRAKYGE